MKLEDRNETTAEAAASDRVNLERLAALGRITAGMAHELSNALMSVIQNVDLIRSEINRLRPHLPTACNVSDLDIFIDETRVGSYRISRILDDLRYLSGRHEALFADSPELSSSAITAFDEPERRRHILIVDDEPSILRASARILGHLHTVITCRSGVEALNLLVVDDRFDLILCDVLMPDMGGAELYAALEKRRPDLARRMVFMTGGACTPEVEEFVRSVRHRCVEKPLSGETLKRLARYGVGVEAGEPVELGAAVEAGVSLVG